MDADTEVVDQTPHAHSKDLQFRWPVSGAMCACLLVAVFFGGSALLAAHAVKPFLQDGAVYVYLAVVAVGMVLILLFQTSREVVARRVEDVRTSPKAAAGRKPRARVRSRGETCLEHMCVDTLPPRHRTSCVPIEHSSPGEPSKRSAPACLLEVC